MQTILVQINSDKALKLLQDLEDLNILKLLSSESNDNDLSQRYGGKLKSKVAEDLQNYVSESRTEWERKNS